MDGPRKARLVEDRIKVSLTPVFIKVKKHVSVFLDDFLFGFVTVSWVFCVVSYGFVRF